MGAEHLHPNREDSEGEVNGRSDEEEEESDDDMSGISEVSLEENCEVSDGSCGHVSCVKQVVHNHRM